MAIEKLATDVFIESAGNRITVVEDALADRPTRRSGRPAAARRDGDQLHPPLRDALRAADFEILAEMDVVPPGRPSPRRRGQSDGGAPQLSVAVGDNESAVLLVEAEGGVFTWRAGDSRLQTAAERRGRGGRRTLVSFRIGDPDGPAAPQRRGRLGEWIGERLVRPLRVYVLRFVVARTLDAAVKHIEGGNPTGPVLIEGPDPTAWVPTPLAHALPKDRPARILLLVHGTFSSTAGSFGQLAWTAEGRAFLDAAASTYDIVLGYDHHTLADDPRSNADAILATLTALSPPPGSVIDAVAFSRGGLVYRVLAEQLLGSAGLDVTLGRAVFVGCTNGGTYLAKPENWAAMVDLYTNAVMATARGIARLAGAPAAPGVGFAIRTIGRFVQMLSEVAISERRIPGLAAMEPDSLLVEALNGASDPSLIARYHAVTSSFEPALGDISGFSRQLGAFLADRITDRLFGEANDLVVHTRSMTDFGPGVALAPERIHAFGDTGLVYHTVYFSSDRVANFLVASLGIGGPAGEIGRGAKASVEEAVSSSLRPKPLAGETPAGRARGGARRKVSIGGARKPVIAPTERASTQMEDMSLAEAAEGMSGDMAPRGAPPATIERHIGVEMAPYPLLGVPANIFIAVSPEAVRMAAHAAAEATVEPMRLAAAKTLVVELIPRRNCRVLGAALVEFDIGSSEEEVRRLRVEGQETGEAELVVEARQDRRVVASFVLRPVFVEAAHKPLAARMQVMPPEPGETFPVLRIYEFKDFGGRLTLRFDLMSDDPVVALSETNVLDPDFNVGAYVAGVLAEIEAAYNLAGSSYDAFLASFSDSAIIRAEALIPLKVRTALWNGRDRIKAIQIISDEALIPWELMCIADPTGQVDEHRGFLSEWGVVRWLHGTPPPPRTFGFSGGKSRWVIPDYLDESLDLAGVEAERAMLSGILPGIKPVTATSLEVCRFMREDAADTDVLHFACHGEVHDKAVLTAKLLMNGNEDADGANLEDGLSADQVKVNLRLAPARPRSLVFLNSCQTGRGGRGIAGHAGFADAFIRPRSGRGAAVFVGALWSIDTHLAERFASAFYAALGAGETLVAAVGVARATCQENSDFTWLAYSVYGHPLARIEKLSRA